MRYLAENWSIIIKPANKGSYIVIWDWEDCLTEDYRQLSDYSSYIDVKTFNQKLCLNSLKKVTLLFSKRLCKHLSQKKSWNIFQIVLRMLVV